MKNLQVGFRIEYLITIIISLEVKENSSDWLDKQSVKDDRDTHLPLKKAM